MYGPLEEMYGNLHFNGALRVAFFEKDEKVEKFLGTRGLGDALSAMHDFYGLDFVLRKCFVKWAGYEFYGFFPHSDEYYARIRRLGAYATLYWNGVNPNRFSKDIVNTLHSGFELFSVSESEYYKFEGDVPSFSCRRELEMRFSLMGGRNGRN